MHYIYIYSFIVSWGKKNNIRANYLAITSYALGMPMMGFEPMHTNIADLKSDALDHSATLALEKIQGNDHWVRWTTQNVWFEYWYLTNMPTLVDRLERVHSNFHETSSPNLLYHSIRGSIGLLWRKFKVCWTTAAINMYSLLIRSLRSV